MLAAFLQHHGQFQLIVELLRQMLRKDDGVFMSDDGVHVLEENNPGHDWMRKASLGGFLVMLAEISGRMKELLGNDRRSEPNGGKIVK